MTPRDRKRFARARALGKGQSLDPSAVVAARYDSGNDAIVLTFRGGGSMTIPRRLVPGLDQAPSAALCEVRVLPPGDALLWPSLDADVYVPGLLERAFGTRLFAAATGRRGSQWRSKAKAISASASGAKRGRPRKWLAAL